MSCLGLSIPLSLVFCALSSWSPCLLQKEVSVKRFEIYHDELVLPNAFYKSSDMII